MRSSSIENIRRKHPREWLLIDVDALDKGTTTPLTGRLIAHSRNRKEIWKKSKHFEGKLKMIMHSKEDLPTAACFPKKATVEGLLGLNFLNKFNLSLFFKDHFLEIR